MFRVRRPTDDLQTEFADVTSISIASPSSSVRRQVSDSAGYDARFLSPKSASPRRPETPSKMLKVPVGRHGSTPPSNPVEAALTSPRLKKRHPSAQPKPGTSQAQQQQYEERREKIRAGVLRMEGCVDAFYHDTDMHKKKDEKQQLREKQQEEDGSVEHDRSALSGGALSATGFRERKSVRGELELWANTAVTREDDDFVTKRALGPSWLEDADRITEISKVCTPASDASMRGIAGDLKRAHNHLTQYCRDSLQLVAEQTQGRSYAESQVRELEQRVRQLKKVLEESPLGELQESLTRKDELIRVLQHRERLAVARVQSQLRRLESKRDENADLVDELQKENNILRSKLRAAAEKVSKAAAEQELSERRMRDAVAERERELVEQYSQPQIVREVVYKEPPRPPTADTCVQASEPKVVTASQLTQTPAPRWGRSGQLRWERSHAFPGSPPTTPEAKRKKDAAVKTLLGAGRAFKAVRSAAVKIRAPAHCGARLLTWALRARIRVATRTFQKSKKALTDKLGTAELRAKESTEAMKTLQEMVRSGALQGLDTASRRELELAEREAKEEKNKRLEVQRKLMEHTADSASLVPSRRLTDVFRVVQKLVTNVAEHIAAMRNAARTGATARDIALAAAAALLNLRRDATVFGQRSFHWLIERFPQECIDSGLREAPRSRAPSSVDTGATGADPRHTPSVEIPPGVGVLEFYGATEDRPDSLEPRALAFARALQAQEQTPLFSAAHEMAFAVDDCDRLLAGLGDLAADRQRPTTVESARDDAGVQAAPDLADAEVMCEILVEQDPSWLEDDVEEAQNEYLNCENMPSCDSPGFVRPIPKIDMERPSVFQSSGSYSVENTPASQALSAGRPPSGLSVSEPSPIGKTRRSMASARDGLTPPISPLLPVPGMEARPSRRSVRMSRISGPETATSAAASRRGSDPFENMATLQIVTPALGPQPTAGDMGLQARKSLLQPRASRRSVSGMSRLSRRATGRGGRDSISSGGSFAEGDDPCPLCGRGGASPVLGDRQLSGGVAIEEASNASKSRRGTQVSFRIDGEVTRAGSIMKCTVDVATDTLDLGVSGTPLDGVRVGAPSFGPVGGQSFASVATDRSLVEEQLLETDRDLLRQQVRGAFKTAVARARLVCLRRHSKAGGSGKFDEKFLLQQALREAEAIARGEALRTELRRQRSRTMRAMLALRRPTAAQWRTTTCGTAPRPVLEEETSVDHRFTLLPNNARVHAPSVSPALWTDMLPVRANPRSAHPPTHTPHGRDFAENKRLEEILRSMDEAGSSRLASPLSRRTGITSDDRRQLLRALAQPNPARCFEDSTTPQPQALRRPRPTSAGVTRREMGALSDRVNMITAPVAPRPLARPHSAPRNDPRRKKVTQPSTAVAVPHPPSQSHDVERILRRKWVIPIPAAGAAAAGAAPGRPKQGGPSV